MELIHRQTGEGVRLAKDHPAGVQIRRVHDGLPVVPRPLQLSPPEGFVKAVIGVPGDEPHTDLGLLGQKTGAQIAALLADDIHQSAVGRFTFYVQDLCIIHPGMPLDDGVFRLGSDGISGIATLYFHKLCSF